LRECNSYEESVALLKGKEIWYGSNKKCSCFEVWV